MPKRQSRGRFVPMRVSEGFRAFVLDQLEDLGEVVDRSMFGGVGLYCRGLFFGLVAADTLYLKVDERNLPDYERAGSKPFRPYANRPASIRYRAVPLEVLENAPELTQWARKAVEAARRAGSGRAARRPPLRKAW